MDVQSLKATFLCKRKAALGSFAVCCKRRVSSQLKREIGIR